MPLREVGSLQFIQLRLLAMRIKRLLDNVVTSDDLEWIELHRLLLRGALDPRDRHCLVCASA